MNEYETPITDEICRTVDRDDLRDTFEEVRDLERKLAMCRDALTEIAAFKTMKSYDAGRVISEDAKDVATEALDQTK